MQKRIFYNPNVKDKVTVLKTAEETNGDHILVEVELKPGGGTPKHYHTSFDETFIPVSGVVGVEVGKKKFRLKNTDMATAKRNEVHRFFNPGDETITFRVRISPAENRFLESLCIGYGLADDGKADKKECLKSLTILLFCSNILIQDSPVFFRSLNLFFCAVQKKREKKVY